MKATYQGQWTSAQLKATIGLREVGAKNEAFSFQCPRRNYDLLTIDTQVPRILIVLRLPRNPDDWLSIDAEQMILRHCAYWTNLNGAAEIESGRDSKSVWLPKVQRFDVAALQRLMEQSRSGKLK